MVETPDHLVDSVGTEEILEESTLIYEITDSVNNENHKYQETLGNEFYYTNTGNTEYLGNGSFMQPQKQLDICS